MRGEIGGRPSVAPAPPRAPVPLARSEDIARRRRIYTIQMTVRLACLLLLPVLPGVWKAAALAGAIFLPYIAVLMANDARTGSAVEDDPGDLTATPPTPLLEAAPHDRAPVRRTLRIDDDGSVIDIDVDIDDPGFSPDPRGGEDPD
ncbi:DUF3099 domain-containing protein [Brachybacterium huguangmaarense]